MNGRDLDVVVLGATGVTGRGVAAYLAERAADTGLRWAAAARDTAKLERVLGEVGVSGAETISADVGDPSSLAAMAARTRVVLDLVGPYTLYGRPVIEACIAAGSHYADLTGELPFVRAMIAEFDVPAREAGVKIVQTAGFESLPPDLMVARSDQLARERHGEGLASIDIEVRMISPPGLPRPSDGVSGGTFQSIAAMAGAEDAATIEDPAILITDPAVAAAVRRISPIALAPRRGRDGAVLAPMAPAAFINPGVIHRSAALIAAAEGRPAEPVRYREAIVLGGGPVTLPARWGVAGLMTASQIGARALARSRPVIRKGVAATMSRLGPSSGFGPSGPRMEGWKWTMTAQGRTAGANRNTIVLEADGHPGYLATARLLGEAGILLAEDGATPARSGCLTPAAALGSDCLPRFAEARLRFAGAYE